MNLMVVNMVYTSVTHDSVLMLPFSCHRPGVCITRPNCKARSDGGEGRGGEAKGGRPLD